MIAEKSMTTQNLMEQISNSAAKVPYISDEMLIKAMTYLENNGIPNNKHEDYKYCNLDAVVRKEFRECGQVFNDMQSLSEYKRKGMLNLVLLNGNFSPQFSDPIPKASLQLVPFNALSSEEKARIGSLASVDQDAFVALNTVYAGNGFYLKVLKDTHPELPIRILNLVNAGSDLFLNSRYFIHLSENSSLEILEEQISLGDHKTFVNSLSERLLEKGAKLKSCQLQSGTNTNYSVNTIQAELAEQSDYSSTTLSYGAQLIRNNHNVLLKGEYAAAHLFGLFVAGGNTLVDNHTLMDHRVPNCESNELYKGIADGKSTGVFNGKIFVRKDAQKTNAYQSSKNILLDDEATINTKPQLEIYANDVKCSHGTSTGRIDEAALFYLKSRGIGEAGARKLLLQAFAQEVMDTVENSELKEVIGSDFTSKIGFE
jgi:Fe-S cluster assembly protein SufD